jgi:ABC-type multidrug transport system fused ATPase/permease subunit
MNFFRNFSNLKLYLDKNHQKRLDKSLILIFISSFIEFFSISAVIASFSFFINSSLSTNEFFFKIKSEYIIFLLSIVFIVYLLRTIFLLIVLKYNAETISRISYYISTSQLINYVNFDYNKFIKNPSSFYIRNLTLDIGKISSFFFHSLYIINECLVILILSILLIIVDYSSFLILTISILPFVILFIKFTKKILYNIGLSSRESEMQKISNIQEIFFGFKLIRHFGAKLFFFKKFIKNEKQVSKAIKNIHFWNGVPKFFLDVLLIAIFVIYILFNYFSDKKITEIFLSFVAFAAVSLRIAPSINRILGSIQGLKLAASSLNDFILNQTEFHVKNNRKELKKNIIKIDEDLLLNKVSFKYNNAPNYIFKNLTFSLPLRSILGIKGKSGVGKSTLVNCLIGQLNFTSGSFLTGNRMILPHNINRSNVGLVTQDTFLMNDTIKKNIAFGIGDKFVDIKKLKEAIRQSSLENFIESLPKKEETVINENSSNISGGQKQRISIARALYFSPQLLIFDEATNALDNQTEKKILEEIKNHKNNNYTVILVSHSSKVLSVCDQVIDLEEYK